jgi:hypothetical protein
VVRRYTVGLLGIRTAGFGPHCLPFELFFFFDGGGGERVSRVVHVRIGPGLSDFVFEQIQTDCVEVGEMRNGVWVGMIGNEKGRTGPTQGSVVGTPGFRSRVEEKGSW